METNEVNAQGKAQEVAADATTTTPVTTPAIAPSAPSGDAAGSAAVPPAAAGILYTDEQLNELKAKWQQDFEQQQSAEKDFAKMTPEQKAQKQLDDQKAETARLQAELADRDLTDYTRGKLQEAKLPAEALPFVKGEDNADTDARIKAFGAMFAAGVQTGVEARYKTNGYVPRVSAAGAIGADDKKRTRGVTFNEKK